MTPAMQALPTRGVRARAQVSVVVHRLPPEALDLFCQYLQVGHYSPLPELREALDRARASS